MPTSQNPYNDPSMMETETDKSFSQSTLQQTSQAFKRLNTNDVAIAQREREINDIAQGIIELADIFKDLQGMVIDQGTILDRIDYNVENMATNVKEADKELNVATNYQRKYTKRKILFLLVLLVIGMFILLLVKPKRSSAPASPPVADPPPPATEPPSQEQDPGGQRSDPINTLNHARPVPEVSTDHLDIVAPNEIPPRILSFK
ncbi:MAG: t-SNARE affecting a late Golgi compartment protein 2 [Ramalina farinacea]|uniref:t-SNARE affecting a late Golgi compartment protein 2 n=1 Tax=Ramalina farinacea TaxID=258253 RepID=A0AA43TRS4_9LECA|nr:t-SNARE affecting a late Golgi compartment protein 2 [Ramalina farinacea]